MHSPALMLRDHVHVHVLKRGPAGPGEKAAWEHAAGPSGLPLPGEHAPRALGPRRAFTGKGERVSEASSHGSW